MRAVACAFDINVSGCRVQLETENNKLRYQVEHLKRAVLEAEGRGAEVGKC